MIIGQVILAYLVVALSVGPIGHQLISWGAPDLALVIIWLAVWFEGEDAGFRWAVIFGLMMDAISFLPFGTYTALYLLLVLLLLVLRNRYLTELGPIQALAALAGVAILEGLLFGLIVRGWDWPSIGLALLIELAVGTASYLIITSRFHFFQRWTGRLLTR